MPRTTVISFGGYVSLQVLPSIPKVLQKQRSQKHGSALLYCAEVKDVKVTKASTFSRTTVKKTLSLEV